ncbi:hypothetical protein SERLADRAFT_468644 [Serpula lacrymans var. lacrymans S7.9]|uniref:Uncharacterized protein n=1 Tax=Serpula lacrymans var. lacrymans (strain S7.9) TaxID=578457 RepID=F8NY39_SERL9|nr:uncharacterized protein SERLADRAFT_468644 [Serpula lacrymans var. lacrymans S7.9]EGO24801.1 hypothetical protein SERLADRAFT_468644 [Serpula lacrymans var. lacrymans S7.9]
MACADLLYLGACGQMGLDDAKVAVAEKTVTGRKNGMVITKYHIDEPRRRLVC